MKIQHAAEILSKTEFNNRTDYTTYPTADYCCDQCNQVVSIALGNLEKHQFSGFSNLNPSDIRIINALETQQIKTSSFLDFYCPGCKRPVKIYFDHWAGGMHGEAGFTIKWIAH